MNSEILNLSSMNWQRVFILFNLICLSCSFFNAQNAGSPESKLESISALINDTVKAEQLYNLGFSLRAEDPMLSFACVKELYSCALAIHNQRYEARAYSLTGILNYRSKEFTKALEYHLKALRIREELKDELEAGRSYTNLGNVYSDMENFEASERYHLKALAIFSKYQDEKQLLNCLCNLGVLKHAQKQNTPAINNFQRALLIAEKINDHESRAMCCNNLGLIYEESGNWDMAMNFYFETVKLNEQMGTHSTLAESYFNVGSVYFGMKKMTESIEWLEKAIRVARQFEHSETESLILGKLAELYASRGDYQLAYECLSKKNNIDTESDGIAPDRTLSFVLPEADTEGKLSSELVTGIICFSAGILVLLILIFSFISRNKNQTNE